MVHKPEGKAIAQLQHFRKKPLVACVQALITGGVFMSGVSPLQAHTVLSNQLPVEASNWVNGSGVASETTVGNTMTITQHVSTATFNWQSFDVGSNARVNFVEPTANSVAINFIGSDTASQVEGMIKSNGEIILINQNGFVFENGSVTDTSGLVASTLQPTQELLTSLSNPGGNNALTGLANPNNTASAGSIVASFTANGSSANAAATYSGSSNAGAISINHGAQLTSENGKPIIILAPNITNAGQVQSSGGQVIMAAASDVVYLQEAPTDGVSPQNDVRGLLVEVGTGGNVTNAIQGVISANQGNVTLMGFAVNQDGRVSATSTINENGTIRLLATQGVAPVGIDNNTYYQINAASSGTVVLGAQSTTEITPEVQYVNGVESTVVASQAITPSRLEIVGGNIQLLNDPNLNSDTLAANARSGATSLTMQVNATSANWAVGDMLIGNGIAQNTYITQISGNNVTLSQALTAGVGAGASLEAQHVAQINVPAGIVDITATQSPGAPMESTAINASAVQIDSGVNINVAGLDSTASMSSNVISVKLQSNELANSPLQKNSFLFGSTVQVDVRADGGQGTPLANIATEQAAMTYTLEQRLGGGGTINLNSEGSIDVQSQSQLNIAGGATTYSGGYVDTTKLMTSTGQIVDIGSASPLATYVGIYGQVSITDPKWGVTQTWTLNNGQEKGVYQAGYLQGYAAGAFDVAANQIIMDGSLQAQAVNGQNQRTVNQQVEGGTLTISTFSNAVSQSIQDIVFANALTQNIGASNLDGSGNALVMDTAILAGSGLSSATFKTNGAISIQSGATLQLSANSKLNLTAGMINVAGANIQGAGANVSLTTQYNGYNSAYDGSVKMTGANVNLQGQWVNDFADAGSTAPININGGSFAVKAQGDVYADNSVINADGGAWLQANKSLTDGAAGSISLIAGGSTINTYGSNLEINGANFRAYGLNSGGTLTLETNQVEIGGAPPPVSDPATLQPLWLADSFFSSGGFSAYNITADGNGLSVADGASIYLQQSNTQLQGNYLLTGNAQNIAAISRITTLPDNLRASSSLDLSSNHSASTAATGDLIVGSNSKIIAGDDSNITLSSDTSINFDGNIVDHGGTVSMDIIRNQSPQGFNYNTAQGVWVGSGANIDVSGTYVSSSNNLGQPDGAILSGGKVYINAAYGYVAIQAGSDINVSGSQATIAMPVVSANHRVASHLTTEGSNGGAINITAAEGAYLEGTIQARGGNAAGTLGGSLQLLLQNGNGPAAAASEIVVVQDAAASDILVNGAYQSAEVLTAANQFDSAGAAQPAVLNGIGIVGAKQIHDAGFASVDLQVVASTATNENAVGTILFQGNTNVNHGNIDLNLAGTLTLDAPVIAWALSDNSNPQSGVDVSNQTAAAVNLSATNISVGSSTMTPVLPGALPAALGGMGQFNVTAGGQNGLITLQGEATTSGFNIVNMNASQDIRLAGLLDKTYTNTAVTDSFQGEFQTYAQLNMTADRIYPTTLSQYILATSSSDGVISFYANNNAKPAPILEADATLTVKSATINQHGNILNPFGIINFEATNQINLTANSLTSVSGQNQLIPFGVTSAGQAWLYPINDATASGPMNLTIGGNQAGAIPVPSKQINLSAPIVAASPSAVVDLSGGGDLVASEFVPGDGGSKNVLLAGNAVGGGTSFAIIPGYSGYAPYDPYLNTNSGLTAGEEVTIGSGSALAAGTYTLLPAQYAVLPGAYVITPEYTSVPQGWAYERIDGAALVSGQFTTAGTNQSYSLTSTGAETQGWSEFIVQPAGAVLSYSQINLTYGDSFFASQATADSMSIPQLAEDAGQFTANVTTALDLPTLLTSGDLGAKVDISANNISVVLAKSGQAGVVELLASELNKDNIGSLFLGGTRSTDGTTGNTVLNVNASDVTVAGNVTLNKSSEIILAATNSVEVANNATLQTQGAAGTPANSVMETSGDSAVLRVANAAQVSLDRTGTAGVTGNLLIDQGATLKAGNSTVSGAILLDTTGNSNRLQGNFSLDSKGSLAIAANDLNLIDSATNPAALNGMSIDSTQLSNLGQIANLNLSGRDYINIYGTIDTPQITNLILNTPVLAGMPDSTASSNNAQINATNLTFANYAGSSCSAASGCSGAGNGSLTVDAAKLTLDATDSASSNGSFAISGYDNTTMNITGQIVGNGKGVYDFQGNVLINTPAISGNTASNTTIDAAGNLTVNNPGNAGSASNGLGAELNLTAANLAVDTSLIYLGGNVNLDSSSGNLQLGDSAVVNVSETQQSAGLNTAVQIAGGDITLTSAADVDAAAGSEMLLSSSATGVAAGTLTVNAGNGNANLNGQIVAGGPDKADGGKLLLDVKSMGSSGFDGYNQIAAADGFTGEFNLRVRNGDINVDQLVTAQNINFDADNGNIIVNATLDATGNNGGTISLSSDSLVQIDGGANLNAYALSAAGNGGNVTLSAVSQVAADNTNQAMAAGSIVMQSNSAIDVRGKGDYTLIDCHSLGECGSLGSVQFLVDRQISAAGVGNVNNVTLNGVINITPYNSGSAGLGYDATQAMPEIIAVKVYDLSNAGGSNVANQITGSDLANSSGLPNFSADAAQFMANLPVSSSYVVLPGIEAITTGGADMVVNPAAAWDLSTWRYSYGAETVPGELILRSSGSLDIQQNITDGFTAVSTVYGTSLTELQTGYSWAYQLIAGADLTSADVSQTVANAASGNLNLGTVSETVGLQNANATSVAKGATSINMQSAAGWVVGDIINGAGIAPNTSILAINGNTVILSAATTNKISHGESISAGTLIRTGTGNIDINVAGDLNMSNASQIYSAGRQDSGNPWGYNPSQVYYDFATYNQYYAEYPLDGGNVSVTAKGNINVSLATSSTQMGFFNDWLIRSGGLQTLSSGTENLPVSWGIDFAKFNDSLGALGGGNVSVAAGGNITNLTVAVPTTGKINPNDYAGNTTNAVPLYTGSNPEPTISGGGNLSVTAGGNIGGGAYYVEQGQANITAGGALTAGSYYAPFSSAYLDPILALGSSQMTVTAADGIALETILNPMAVASGQSYGKLLDALFFTYGSNSSVALTAYTGDVTLVNNAIILTGGTDIPALSGVVLTTYPDSLTVNALLGSLNIMGSMQLFPSASGNLNWYAYDNIDTSANATNDTQILLSAVNPASLPSVTSPESVKYKNGMLAAYQSQLTLLNSVADYAETPIHLNDANPALISTGVGSIENLGGQYSLLFALSKQALVSAGANIYDTSFMIQNDTAASNSLISAGQNIEFNTLRDPATGGLNTSNSNQIIQVSGPGQLTVLSGGNINLGASSGILSVGNTGVNPFLPAAGANLTVLAGLGSGSINASGFAQNFMTDSSASQAFDGLFSAAMQNLLIQSGSVPTISSMQTLVSQAQASAVSTLGSHGQSINFGYKEYFTQYLLDYWNHYTGNLAVDGVITLINQAEAAVLTAPNTPQTVVANEYAAYFNQNMQTALSQYSGVLTLSGFNNLMRQAEAGAYASLTSQSVMTAVIGENYTAAQYLSWINTYQSAFNQGMQGFFSAYSGAQPVALAVAGVLNSQAATSAQTSFDQVQQAYSGELTQSLQAYLPSINANIVANTFSCTNSACTYETSGSASPVTVPLSTILASLSSQQLSLVEKQLLPYVQTVYGMDQQQFAEVRAASTSPVDINTLELDMLATTENLYPGTTLLSLNPVAGNIPLTSDYHYDQVAGWVANSGNIDVNTIIDNTDIVQLQAIAQLYGNVINLGGSSVDINSAIQTVSAESTSAYGKTLLSEIYAARPDIQAAVRPVAGDLSLFFSTIQTKGGGNINLLTPNGGIDAGLSATTLGQKPADQLGIIVRGQGGINAFLRDNFQVNLTRVMTMDGGDVVAGSSEGSIDAGKGVALNGAIEEQVSYDIYGNPVISFLPAVTTSGIRSAAPIGSGIEPGTIVLFAPRGIIDAGEAGIAGGNLFLDSPAIKNAANINSSTGVSVGTPPSAPPAGISAALSGTSGLSASVNKSFESSTDVGKDTADNRFKASSVLGVLSVDLIGFGDD